jgi:hypothetical protein
MIEHKLSQKKKLEKCKKGDIFPTRIAHKLLFESYAKDATLHLKNKSTSK